MIQVKKIGSIFFVGVWHIALLSVDLSLKVFDEDEKSVQQVSVGQPFTLLVEAAGQTDSIKIPEIDGLQHFLVLDKNLASTVHLSINGVRSTKKIYQYALQAKETGKFPFTAFTIHEGKRVRSQPLVITVVKEVEHKELQRPTLKLLTKTTCAYPGQEIELLIRFYPQETQLEGITPPILSAFQSEKMEGPFTDHEMHGDVEIAFIEWKIKIYPLKAGKFVIPAINGVYIVNSSKKRHPSMTGFDVFNQLFSPLEKKQIRSNSLEITVQELPSYEGQVDGVGNFTKIESEVDHHQAHVGEAIVYRLIVHASDNNFHFVNYPKLKLPRDFSSYESKTYIQDGPKNTQQKVFEYIIQGQKPGEYRVPAQTLTFFNISKKDYVTLKSKAVDITICAAEPYTVSEPEKILVEPKMPQHKQNKNSIITEDMNRYTHEIKKMPWYYVLLLLLIPVFIIFAYFMHRTLKNSHLYKVIRKKQSLKKLRKQLYSAQKKRQPNLLWHIFVSASALIKNMPESQIQQQDIKDLLVHSTVSQNEQRIDHFIQQILDYRFGNASISEPEVMHIFQEAKLWLESLQRF